MKERSPDISDAGIRVALIATIAAVTLGVGCTRTVIGGYTDAQDGKHRVYARVFGAYGHSFLDDTKKTVRVSIVANAGSSKEALLLRKDYSVHGSDVGWEAIWDKNNNLKIVCFDYGIGVDREDARQSRIPKRQLRAITYHFDSRTGFFTEKPNE